MIRRQLAQRALLLCTLLLSACVGLPPRPEATKSFAIAASPETQLSRIATASTPPPPQSGFRLVHSGTMALDARIALIRAAERSLDVQYYHVASDNTGRGFLVELKAAAVRGVRVRLLLDDLYAAPVQDELLGLASHRGVEVRLFNPLPVRRGGLLQRFLPSVGVIDRLQMRMHNKLLVADGAFAITGGRNIADEYYWQSTTDAFFDLDVLLAGVAVADLTRLFDDYWNDELAWPVDALAKPGGDVERRRQRFDAFVAGARLPESPRVARDLLGYGRLRDELVRGRVELHVGQVRAVADEPHKVDEGFVAADLWDAPSRARRAFNSVTRDAQRDVMLVTPYFVPGVVGLERRRAHRIRGIRTRTLTNSLASTDETFAHAGYARYRRAMLETGAELYELDPVRSKRLELAEVVGEPTLRIHSKAAVVDRRVVYLGSMNLDPRSVALNTEIGVIIDSEPLARDVLFLLEALIQNGAWRVRLDANQELLWESPDPAEPPLRTEPRTTFWDRWRLRLLSVLVPESVL